jgi:selenocysteine-specific elongation factor
MRVIGTAGHVDHGKSTLVRSITGIDPDRLAEEKARALTIDLGFAWFPLVSGELVGIVDVPGHRDFIENMLAGVGGIDLVMLIVAADEGVMPQTLEHLAIIDLLAIPSGVIVLTKSDLIDDPDWLEMVELDLRETLAGTILAEAPLVHVSAHSGAGIPQLLTTIEQILDTIPERVDLKEPRLPVDRVFTMEGFGTVVTGTLTGGSLHVGDMVEVQPGNLRARVRSLQNYRQSVSAVHPGTRVAVNLAGLNRQDIDRGAVISLPGQIRPTYLVDVQLRHLPGAKRELRHNDQVKFFSGTGETLARLRLLGQDTLQPGQTGWAQLVLEHAQALSLRDRFIIRVPSPAETVGGGLVINTHPARRWKRFRNEVLLDLQARLDGTPEERVIRAAASPDGISFVQIGQATGIDSQTLMVVMQSVIERGLLYEIESGRFIATSTLHNFSAQMIHLLETFHATYPIRSGIPREELRQKLGVKQTVFNLLLRDDRITIIPSGNLIQCTGHQITLSHSQRQQQDSVLSLLQSQPFSPPGLNEWTDQISEEVIRAMVELNQIILITPDIAYTVSAFEQIVAKVLEHIEAHGSIDAKTLRDLIGASRKYAIGILEYLDQIGITKRDGDVRVRGSKAW